MTLNVVFAGTPEFSAHILSSLLASEHNIMAVYTQPDRPAGRGQVLHESAVKKLAIEHKVPVFQPTRLMETDEAVLQEMAPDVMVVVAYGLILPKAILSIPKHGCINVHASVLPRWRGAAPIQRAIESGDKTTGVSIMQMDEGLDTGPVFQITNCPIEMTDTAADIHDRLAGQGAGALLDTLHQLDAGSAQAKPQDEAHATYAHKLKKIEAKINWQHAAVDIERKIRAFNPWPICFALLDDKTIRCWQARIDNETPYDEPPGTIVSFDKTGLMVATGNGLLVLEVIQLPGKKPQPIHELANAYQGLFTPGAKFT